MVVDNCADTVDASVPMKNHQDKMGPITTMAFVTLVWMIVPPWPKLVNAE